MYVSVGGPLFLITVGAILYWATDFDLSGVDMNTVGLILLIAGVIALVLSLSIALYNSRAAAPPPPRR